MSNCSELAQRMGVLRDAMSQVVIGQEKVKEQVLVCLLAGGHTLLEGVPGVGKTLTALTLSKLLGCRFGRVQFTPDLMPTDVLGTNIYNEKTQTFEFHAGPIFTDFLLADEVNRTPPKTQSALLEAMQEKAVTIDGVRHVISPVFTVFATQNPVEFEGTYPLPEAQRDRFLMKISITYPKHEEELEMLNAYVAGRKLHEGVVDSLKPIMSLEDLVHARAVVAKEVRAEPNLLSYILKIVSATRGDESIQIAASPRATLALLESSRALALLRGRDFIIPDDVKEMAGPVLSHRITLSPEAEMEGIVLNDILRRIFEKIEVPR